MPEAQLSAARPVICMFSHQSRMARSVGVKSDEIVAALWIIDADATDRTGVESMMHDGTLRLVLGT